MIYVFMQIIFHRKNYKSKMNENKIKELYNSEMTLKATTTT